MNKFTGQFVHAVPRAFALTALAAAFSFSPANAAVYDVAQTRVGTVASPTLLADATPAATKKTSGHRAADKISDEESAETRIKYLHDKFKITPAQEETWNKVAGVIRENADQITALVKNRAENAKTMTAVDDLNSYAEIAGAHEDGTKKLIPVFKTLYDDMSDAQKKAADTEFRNHGRYEHHRHHHAAT